LTKTKNGAERFTVSPPELIAVSQVIDVAEKQRKKQEKQKKILCRKFLLVLRWRRICLPDTRLRSGPASRPREEIDMAVLCREGEQKVDADFADGMLC